MNTLLDGTLKLTKREKEILTHAPLLAALIAVQRPAATEGAASIRSGCEIIRKVLLTEKTG